MHSSLVAWLAACSCCRRSLVRRLPALLCTACCRCSLCRPSVMPCPVLRASHFYLLSLLLLLCAATSFVHPVPPYSSHPLARRRRAVHGGEGHADRHAGAPARRGHQPPGRSRRRCHARCFRFFRRFCFCCSCCTNSGRRWQRWPVAKRESGGLALPSPLLIYLPQPRAGACRED